MSLAEPTIEANLRRAARRWRAIQFLSLSARVGLAGGVICLLLGVAMVRGWITSPGWAGGLAAIAVLFLLLDGVWRGYQVLKKTPDRAALAGAVEDANEGLLDRLNTLVYLERERRSDRARWFFPRLARQAGGVLGRQAQVPFGASRAWWQAGGLVILLAGTGLFYAHYRPWEHLAAAQTARTVPSSTTEKAVELALPTNNVAEEKKVWGEVRITDPARDLKVTKVDVVPLQIEAAANQGLKHAAWFSTINGSAEKAHELPAPPEPRYAVYQPVLYLDEFRLADWDVMTYYANAQTGHGETYASEVFFIEVRPFREDILKMPGGEGGKAYAALSEMTGLIERQQHVIRETHRYQQAPVDRAKLREQDRRKLAEAEEDLSVAARHLYARMASEMENQPIGEALDHLAKAAHTLTDAGESLQKDAVPEAQNLERSALLDLVAMRKMFQKAVSDHPGGFKDRGDESPGEETPPIAETSKKLNEIAEFRNEAKAAQDFVNEAVAKQKRIATQAASALPAPKSPLAAEEKDMQTSLEDFQAQHPATFQAVSNEFKATEEALKSAAGALERKAANARSRAEAASGELEKLATAMANKNAGRELADAYRLKQLLDQQVQRLEQMQQVTNDIPSPQLGQAAEESRQTLEQLREVAQTEPTSGAFGPQLKQSLTGTNQAALDGALDQLAKSRGMPAQKAAAAGAREGLARVSQAFGDSQPSATQAARKSDPLKPGDQESFERGMNQLESLQQQMENGHALTGDQQAQLRGEALRNLSEGVSKLFGNNAHSQDVHLLLEQELKDPSRPLDLARLKKLMDQLRAFSIEVADQRNPEQKPDLTGIDPSRLPPAYRGRIEKYYQKLSEQKP